MRTGKRSARRAILVGMAVFALSQIVLALAAQGWLAVRDPDQGHKMRVLEARLEPGFQRPAPAVSIASTARGGPRRQSRPLTVVQIGSSRTVHGLRGQVVERLLEQRLGRPAVVFNLGNYGAGPIVNRLALERLMGRGVRPDLVLVEVHPALLADEFLSRDALADRIPASHLSYGEMRLLQRLVPERPQLQQEWWLAQATPWFANRFALVTAVAPSFLHLVQRTDRFSGVDESGWLPLITPPSGHRRALAQAEREYRQALQQLRLSPRGLAVLRETIERCREVGARAALVLMPEGPIFRSWYPPAVWRQVEETLAGFSREAAAPLIDLRDCVGEEGFLDSHHLYPEGAARFSKCLAERLEPLL